MCTLFWTAQIQGCPTDTQITLKPFNPSVQGSNPRAHHTPHASASTRPATRPARSYRLATVGARTCENGQAGGPQVCQG
jgi:hypothetical protein